MVSLKRPEIVPMPTSDCPLLTADTGCRVLEAGCFRPALVHRGGPVYCHCPPSGGGSCPLSRSSEAPGRRGCGVVTAHRTAVAACPTTVKRSESLALSLGFIAYVLGMRPPECFLSINLCLPKWLYRTMGFVGVGGARDFVLGIWRGKIILLDPMCLYYSAFCGEFESA